MVVVDEDCSRIGDEVQGAGRRGMCGSGFVYKVRLSTKNSNLHSFDGYIVIILFIIF